MPRFHRPLRASLLAAALAAIPLATVAATAAAQETAIELPAGPLGRSLSAFASQRGIALSFDPTLTAGLQAPALHGAVGDREGLERLLAGSGLRLLARADGSYTLEKTATGTGVVTLSPLRIGAQRTFPYSEGIVLDQDYIQGSVKGDSDIATLLRINPAVQFSDTARTSRNMGEIRPADISINGMAYYQNLFLLDGVSFNNDIDPAYNIYASSSNITVDPAYVPSTSQGIALDSDLIGSLTVYDSNVPAAFGGFSGGVVDAQSRRAADDFSGKVWYRMARSAWDELIVGRGQETSYEESSTYFYQPHYDKYKLGVQLEGRSANGIGLIGNFVRTRSDIPLRGYESGSVSEGDSFTKTQTRENTSAMLHADWSDGDGVELAASLNYVPTEEHYFRESAKNSGYDLKSGGPVLSLRANFAGDTWTFSNTLGYSDLESSRYSDADDYKNWARSEEKNWGINNNSWEGGYGDVEQTDRKISYALRADREALDWGRSEHNLQFGLGYQQRKVEYHRLTDSTYYYGAYRTTSCTLSDGSEDSDSCSLSPVLTTSGNVTAGQGQYFRSMINYRTGSFTVSGREWNAYVQDDIRIGRWSIRPGVRLDDDDIWNKSTIAPRLAVSWDVLGTQDTLLTGGLNRYYGRNFFSYLLREGRESLMTRKSRTSSSTSWDDATTYTYTSTNRISDVDIPYSDEWTVGLAQRWAGLDFTLKYVHRDNHDEVLRQYLRSNDTTGTYSSYIYQYVNAGRSTSDTWTLTIAPQRPWQWRGTSTQWQFGFDYTDVRRNYNSYNTSSSEAADELVRYKGELTYLYDLPSTDYNRPWTVRLSTQTNVGFWGGNLMWSNFLRWRAGYRDIAEIDSEDYEDTTIAVYGDVTYPRSFTWDSTLEYTYDLPREQQVYLRVEAMNVLNRSTLITGTSTSNTYYEPGRSYWLEVGYRF